MSVHIGRSRHLMPFWVSPGDRPQPRMSNKDALFKLLMDVGRFVMHTFVISLLLLLKYEKGTHSYHLTFDPPLLFKNSKY